MNSSRRAPIRAIIFLAALTVASCFEPFATNGKKHPPASPIDLNTATVEALQQLPGLGPSTAQAIVTFRA